MALKANPNVVKFVCEGLPWKLTQKGSVHSHRRVFFLPRHNQEKRAWWKALKKARPGSTFLFYLSSDKLWTLKLAFMSFELDRFATQVLRNRSCLCVSTTYEAVSCPRAPPTDWPPGLPPLGWVCMTQETDGSSTQWVRREKKPVSVDGRGIQ